MIINNQAPEISKEGLTVVTLHKMTEATLTKMVTYRKDAGGVLHKPIYKSLICALKDPNYRCPAESKWRNEGSDSENEDLGVVSREESDEENVGTSVAVVGAGESSSLGGISVSVPKKVKGKRKRRSNDDELEIVDIEDFLKENRKKALKKVQGTASGSGPTSSTAVNPNQQQTLSTQNPQPTPPVGTSSSIITTTAGGVTVDVGEMQIDLRMMKESFLEMMKRQKKFEEEVTTHYRKLQSQLTQEVKQRIAENEKLKEKVETLEVDNQGLKEYSKMLIKKVEKVEKKNKELLRLTAGEEGDADKESDEEESEGDDDEDTESESEG